ncbi:MAG TPA: hypothetical protein VE173_00575, partial [Longimicrobiales bacterium]|nr:hypothetical protein [Longimicrobiales bacterium]
MRVRLLTVGLLALGAGGVLLLSASAGEGANASRCPRPPTPPDLTSQVPVEEGARLIPEKDKVEIPFGMDREAKTREIPVNAEGVVLIRAREVGAVIRGDITREDRASTLP